MQSSSQSILSRVTSLWHSKAPDSQLSSTASQQLLVDSDPAAEENDMHPSSDQLLPADPTDEEKARKRARKKEKRERRERERLQEQQEAASQNAVLEALSSQLDGGKKKKKSKKLAAFESSAEGPSSQINSSIVPPSPQHDFLPTFRGFVAVNASQNAESPQQAADDATTPTEVNGTAMEVDGATPEPELPVLPQASSQANGTREEEEFGEGTELIEPAAPAAHRTPSPEPTQSDNEPATLTQQSPSKKSKKRKNPEESELGSPKKRSRDAHSSPEKKKKKNKHRTSMDSSQPLAGETQEASSPGRHSVYSIEPTPELEGVSVTPIGSSKSQKEKKNKSTQDNTTATPAKKAVSYSSSKQKTPKAKATPSKRRLPSPNGDRTEPSGKFSEMELDRIASVVEEFREANRLSQAEVNDIIQSRGVRGKKNAQTIWNQIAEQLPGRKRQSILKVCRRKFHNFPARGVWTEEDEDDLRSLQAKHPNQWKVIGEIMNRHPEDCRDRWRNYTICGKHLHKEHWTDEEEDKLREAVNKQLEHIREQRAKKQARNEETVEDSVKPDDAFLDWQLVSSSMDHTRSRLQCYSKWKLLKNLEDSDDDTGKIRFSEHNWRRERAEDEYMKMRKGDEYQLLCAIRDSQAGSESKIPWLKIRQDLGDSWSTMARKLAWIRLREKVPNNEDMKLQEIVSYLAENMENKYANQLEDFYKHPASQRKRDRQHKKTKTKANGAPTSASKKDKTKSSRPEKQLLSNEYIDDEDDVDPEEGDSEIIEEEPEVTEEQARSRNMAASPKKSNKHRRAASEASVASSESNFDDMDDIPARRPVEA